MTEASRVQKLLIDQNNEINRLRNRIEKLEAALASVLRFDLTDETWVKLGFDPLFIRDAFDAAIKTLNAE